MSDDLKTLAQNREVLLLAEAAAWLHDYRKCSEEQLQVQAANRSPTAQGLPRNALTNHFNSFATLSVSFPSAVETLLDLLNEWKGKSQDSQASLLLQYISRCHNTAHFDKQEPDGSGKQNYPGIKISTAFGFETAVGANLTSKLWGLPWNKLSTYSVTARANLRSGLGDLFSTVGADTRRPINEIGLWDWGLLVGALYKSALAGALLGFQPQADALRWRLLSVRLDGLAYFAESHRLPDLLARRKLLGDTLDKIQELLEVTYPLGTEVYRDEDGSVFVVPGYDPGTCKLDVLALTGKGRTLQQIILDQVEQVMEGEILPEIKVDERPWWGQDPQRQGDDELPLIAEHLRLAAMHPDQHWVERQWQGRSDDVCTVCGLRPQGPSLKSHERGVCDTCEQRRDDRSETWTAQNADTTIWTDEVADTNGWLALVVGRFDLTHWLDGNLVQTLTVVDLASAPGKTARDIAKNASFARIRRVWQTTQEFWQDIQESLNANLTDDRRRLLLWLDQAPDLGRYHTYELEVGGTILSLVWHPPTDGQTGHFISADNLGYTARQLGAEKEIYTSPAAAAIYVEDYLRKHFVAGGQSPVLHNPEATGTGRMNLIPGRFIIRLEYQEAKYATAIPILAEPRNFMALVPADKALDVIQAIKQKYEREMGKVRNRLPLHLGVVYFHRRTPLHAALDAGRRMLDFVPAADGGWTVTEVADSAKDAAPDHLQDAQFACWRQVTLQREARTITWRVPLRMGDGATEDAWYPYVFLETEPLDRDRRFQAPNPWSGDDGWLVHAGDLKTGDVVYFVPATFDFEYLDATARRFEVSYADGRRRGADRVQRPYLLDDLERVEDVWKTLDEGLSTSQIKGLATLIETKRVDWEKPKGDRALALPGDDPFRRLCRDALANAGWRWTKWKDFASERRKRLVRAAINGLLSDALELYLTIAKKGGEKTKDKEAD